MIAKRAPAQGHFHDGIATQGRIVGALILRELSARFGRENLGYLWMIGEPLMLATVITLVHLSEPTHFSSDITPAPFAILGYTIFIIFRGIVNRSESIVDNNRESFYHRAVSIFDLLVARAVIEAAGCVASTIILLGLAIMLGLADFPVRPLYLIGAIALMVWWSFALSLIVARITYRNETMGRQVHVITYFCIPASGAFWQLSSTPPYLLAVLRWFPMPLIFEQARYGQFRYTSAQYVDPLYVSAVCAVLTYLGLLLVRRLRSQL